MNIFIDSYGCSANVNNAEIIKGLLTRAGHIMVNDENLADLVILNTCIVKGPTETKMIEKIKNQTKPLIVSGCMPEIDYEVLDNISTIGPRHIKEITKVVEQTLAGNIVKSTGNNVEIKLGLPKVNKNKYISIIQISEGCLGNCSYCITKFAKGDLTSYPKDKIIKEIESSIKNGCKEIWLTSQDCGCYGMDIDTNILELMKDISNLKGNFKVRLGMANPNHLVQYTDKLIDFFNSDTKFYKFLHIPIQSASNNVLKDMNRNYEPKDVKSFIETMRAKDDFVFATDIIAGFPTETDKDFNQTLEFIKEIQPEAVNISKYWPMKNTKAAELEQLPRNIIENRSKTLHEEFISQRKERNKFFIGKEFEVLVDDGKKNNWIARTDSYRQVIINNEKDLLGKFVKVKITDSGIFDLKAELIN